MFTLPPTTSAGGTTTAAQTPPPSASSSTAPATTAVVTLEKGGSFTIALRPDKAPQTVARFAQKARSGFYGGLTFHRVEDWVVQGGDPSGNGTGGGRVPSEYNDLSFKLGAVGIARGQDPAWNNDSQWFVVKKDSTFLDKQYTNFGQVTSGMDVIMGIKIGDKIKSITIQ
ncbi:MAG: peptidylprolyl isomerase [Chloroflexota bacterium]|nr:peptidylprolyl isomerase [Chloroflexota bacterium]